MKNRVVFRYNPLSAIAVAECGALAYKNLIRKIENLTVVKPDT